MKIAFLGVVVVVSTMVLGTLGVHASQNTGLGFNAASVSGISGKVSITGGGAYSPPDFTHSAFIHLGGGFSCIETVTAGPLSNDINSNGPVEGGPGCQAGEGVRWDSVELFPHIQFKCFSADTPHTAATGDKTVVLLADFYEASDGIHESFHNVPMIISAVDLRPDLDGAQNVWIPGVGCGSAIVHFS